MSPWPVEASPRGAPAAARPRGSGGHPEVQAERRAQHPRAGLGARDGRAGRRRRAGEGVPAGARRGGPLTRDPDRLGARTRRERALTLEDFAEVDVSPVRCLDAEARRAMVAEIDALRKENESLGGVFEVLAFGLTAWSRLARQLGGAPRRPSRDGDPVDPGAEGRLDRRGLRVAGLRARKRTTRSSARSERGYYRETNRAGGLEGGMRPASRWSCAAR